MLNKTSMLKKQILRICQCVIEGRLKQNILKRGTSVVVNSDFEMLDMFTKDVIRICIVYKI